MIRTHEAFATAYKAVPIGHYGTSAYGRSTESRTQIARLSVASSTVEVYSYMAEAQGFEPRTYWLTANCSNLLS